MENKTKTIALIFTLYTALFAGYELWGPVSVVGDSAEAAVLRLGHTPAAALQPDSILVKLPDSTIGTYPLSAAMSDSVPWDFITDKPDSFQSKNHNHPISDVNNLIDSLNKKYNTADTNKLQQKITGAATTVTSNNLTVSSALISNSSGKIAVSPVTSAELGYLDGVTSNIQTQIGSKSDTSHNHALSDVTGLNGALSGKEPTITGSTEGKFWNGLKQWVNITIGNVLGLNDTITNHRTAIASKLNISDTSSLARKNHGHSQSQITGLVDTVTAHRNAINNKQPLDTDLTTIAGLTHSNRHVMVSNGSSWTRRALVAEDIPNLSAAKITSGTLDNARLSFDPSSFAKLSLGTVRAAGGFATSLETGRDVFASGLYTYRFMGDALNKPAGISWGSVLTWGVGEFGAGQLAVGWTDGDHNTLMFRSLRDAVTPWWNWKQIYHTGYKPTPDDIGAAPVIHSHTASHLPGNIVYTDNAQTISGEKTFSSNTTFGGNIITSKGTMAITPNTSDGADTKGIILGYESTTRGAGVGVYGNETGHGGDLLLQAGTGNGTKAGAIRINSPLMYFGTRPANDHRWTLALDQYNTLHAVGSGTNIMHNLYFDGTDWRYRYGANSNSGAALLTMAYNQFSVSMANNGTTGTVATLNPAIYTNLNGNTAFGKNNFVGGYRLEVEGNALVNGNETITGSIDVGGNLQTRNNISLLNKAGNDWLNFATRDVSGSEAKFRLSNIADLAMEAVSPFLTITPYSNGGIVFNTPSSPSGQHAHWITRSANDGVLRISREVNGEGSLMMAFAPNVNDILFDSDLYIQGEVFAHDKITIYSNPTGGNIIVPYGLDIRGGTEGSGYTGRLELRSSIASLSLVNTTSRYTVATDFVMEESDHVVSSGIKHEVYEQITSSSANYNPGKSLLRLWHSEAMTIVFANLPSNPTGYNTAAIFTVFNPSSVTHSVNGVSIWPNQSRQFIYDYSASKWMTSY